MPYRSLDMTYEIQPLAFDPTSLNGLSAKLIGSHHLNNYGGAVRRLNAIRSELTGLDWSSTPGYRINGIKREELIAANSAFLHELYFQTLGAGDSLKPGGLSVAFSRDFGSFERWCNEFSAIGKALAGGSGWVLCSWSTQENRLLNHWSADHTHLLGGATPILALDMYEHAYHIDFGADASSYVETFLLNIDWDKANARYAVTVEHATSDLAVPSDEVLADPEKFLVLDVRRAGAYEAAKSVITGATWRDPERVEEWSSSLPAKPVVVYCVYGHEVGRATAAILRSKGIDARFLVGGIHDWTRADRPVEEK